MTDIELRNENGKIVGYDQDGNKVSVDFESLGAEQGDIEEYVGSTTYDRDEFQERNGVTYRSGTELEPHSTNKAQGTKYQILDHEHPSQPMRRSKLAGMLPHERNKARICFMFDWDADSHYDWLFPKFQSRGMPWTGNFSWHRVREDGDTVNLDQLEEMIVKGGMECGVYPRDSSGKDISSMADEDPQLVSDFLLAVRRDFEDNNVPITYLQFRQGEGINREDIIDDNPQIYPIRSLFDASGNGSHRPDPTSCILSSQVNNHPSSWGSLTNDSWLNLGALDNPSDFKSYLDRLIEVNGQVTFFGHAGEIMDTIGGANFEGILDHAQDARKNGDVEVATQTGLQTIPYEQSELNIVADSDASASAVYAIEDYWSWTRGAPSVASDGGYSGSDYYVLGTDDEIGLLNTCLEPEWNSITLDMQAKAPDTETASFKVAHQEQNGTQANYISETIQVGDSWERVFFQSGSMRDGVRALLRIMKVSGTVHLDNIKIYPA